MFCPKFRRKVLVPPIDARFKAIARAVCSQTRSALIEMEVMADHVHLRLECDPPFGINRLVRSIKGRSSHVLRQAFPSLKSRLPSLWTNAYFVSRVGGAPRAVIKRYSENQKNV